MIVHINNSRNENKINQQVGKHIVILATTQWAKKKNWTLPSQNNK